MGITFLSTDIDPAASALEPVLIEHVQEHPFGKDGKRGCSHQIDGRRCGKAKTWPGHHGYVQSVNVLGSGNPMAYQTMKQAWQTRFAELLEEADLPRGLQRVTVEAEITFPTRAARDQDNHRGLLAKSLGDALVEGGWLPADTFFPVCHFEFGNLTAVYAKGTAKTRLMLFPLAMDLTQG